MVKSIAVPLLAGALLTASSSSAAAQPSVEFGSSLAGVLITLEDDLSGSSFGVPSSSLGLIGPGVYASLFLGSRFAVEPRGGFVWTYWGDGESSHYLDLGVQGDVFFSGLERRSLYLFGGGGAGHIGDHGWGPKFGDVGLGYRMPVGQHLVFRLDGRFIRWTTGRNKVAITFSMGAAFGR